VEGPDRPAVSSRPYGQHPIRIALTHPQILRRWIEGESTRGIDGTKPVHASCIMQHLRSVLTSSAGRRWGAGQAHGHSHIGQRPTHAGVSRNLARSPRTY